MRCDHAEIARVFMTECMTESSSEPSCPPLSPDVAAKFRPACGEINDATVDSHAISWALFDSGRGWNAGRSAIEGSFTAQRCHGTFVLELESTRGKTLVTDAQFRFSAPADATLAESASVVAPASTKAMPREHPRATTADDTRARAEDKPPAPSKPEHLARAQCRARALDLVDCLVHADGDGVLDVVGRRTCDGPVGRMRAFSGVDGHLVWEESVEGPLICAGDEHVVTQNVDRTVTLWRPSAREHHDLPPGTRLAGARDAVLARERDVADAAQRLPSGAIRIEQNDGLFGTRHELVAGPRAPSAAVDRDEAAWRVQLPGSLTRGVAWDHDVLRISSAKDVVVVFAPPAEPEPSVVRFASFDVAAGTLLFEGDTAEFADAPPDFAETNGEVIVFAFGDRVVAVDARSGAPRWRL